MSQDDRSDAVSEDTRAKFREALEKKSAQTHRVNAEHAGSGQVVGPGSNDKTKRQFRRKSG